jgi:hypothetical protein
VVFYSPALYFYPPGCKQDQKPQIKSINPQGWGNLEGLRSNFQSVSIFFSRNKIQFLLTENRSILANV